MHSSSRSRSVTSSVRFSARAALLVASVLGPAAAVPAASLAAPTWSTPTTIGQAVGQNQPGGTYQLAADAQGNEVALWLSPHEAESTGPDLLTAARPAGGSWSQPQVLQRHVLAGIAPQLSVSADGWAASSWLSEDDLSQSKFAVRAPQGSWSSPGTFGPTRRSDGYPFTPQYPSIQVGPRGALVVGYLSDILFTPKGNISFWGTSTRPAGSSTFTVLNDVPGSARTVAFTPSGGLVLARPAYDGDTPAGIDLWTGTTSLANSGRATPVTRGRYPSVLPAKYTASGAGIIAWTEYDGSTAETFAVRKPANGDWSAPVKLGEGEATQVATAGEDAFVELLRRNPHEYYDYVAQVAHGGASGAWDPAETVAEASVDDIEQGTVPVLSGNDAGDAVVTWQQRSGVGLSVRTVGGSWSRPELPASAAGARTIGASIATNGTLDALWLKGSDVQSATTPLRSAATPTPTPTTVKRSVVVRANVSTFLGRCPAKVQIAINARLAGLLPTTDARGQRCSVRGTVAVPATYKPGATVLVIVTGRNVWPVVKLARVVNG